MAVIIRIPTTLRPLTAGQAEVEVEAGTVGEALALRRFVNVVVSDDDVRFLDGLDTAVPEGGTVAIVPAVAGG